jgi:hypothetical protein
LKELLKDLFQCSDAERTSFKERRAISPTTTATPYSGSPGLVIIDIALEEIALEEIMLKSILIPPFNAPNRHNTLLSNYIRWPQTIKILS